MMVSELLDIPSGILRVVLSSIIPSGRSLPGGFRFVFKQFFISDQDNSPLTKSMHSPNASKVGIFKTQRGETPLPKAK